jgi:MFS family permease
MNASIMQKSVVLGAIIGAIFGGLIGAAFGAMTLTLNGILVGLVIGLALGVVTGALTAALTVRTAGRTGGIGVGYFTGMVFGAVFGMMLGALIPPSLGVNSPAEGLPIFEVLMPGRFGTAMFMSFSLSILATIVGVWIAGKNLVPEKMETVEPDHIDQFDLVEVIAVPERHQGIIDIGDIGVVIEIDDNQSFEIECIRPDGSYKWVETLNIKYVRLKHKIPDNINM